MTTFFLKTFVNETVSSSSKVVLFFARAESQDISKICKMRNSANYNILNILNTYFKCMHAVYMRHGFAILIPFSIMSRPKVDK